MEFLNMQYFGDNFRQHFDNLLNKKAVNNNIDTMMQVQHSSTVTFVTEIYEMSYIYQAKKEGIQICHSHDSAKYFGNYNYCDALYHVQESLKNYHTITTSLQKTDVAEADADVSAEEDDDADAEKQSIKFESSDIFEYSRSSTEVEELQEINTVPDDSSAATAFDAEEIKATGHKMVKKLKRCSNHPYNVKRRERYQKQKELAKENAKEQEFSMKYHIEEYTEFMRKLAAMNGTNTEFMTNIVIWLDFKKITEKTKRDIYMKEAYYYRRHYSNKNNK
jgi:hypothetical protein